MDRTIFNQTLTEVATSARDQLGALRCESGIWYKYVMLKNVTGTVAGVAGDPVHYVEGVTLKGYVNNHVALDLTDGDTQPTGAGFLLATVTGTAGTAYYVWIQLTGLVTVPTAIAGTPVVGSYVQPSTSSGTDKTLTLGTGVINKMGIATQTTAANNKIIATCPF